MWFLKVKKLQNASSKQSAKLINISVESRLVNCKGFEICEFVLQGLDMCLRSGGYFGLENTHSRADRSPGISGAGHQDLTVIIVNS